MLQNLSRVHMSPQKFHFSLQSIAIQSDMKNCYDASVQQLEFSGWLLFANQEHNRNRFFVHAMQSNRNVQWQKKIYVAMQFSRLSTSTSRSVSSSQALRGSTMWQQRRWGSSSWQFELEVRGQTHPALCHSELESQISFGNQRKKKQSPGDFIVT